MSELSDFFRAEIVQAIERTIDERIAEALDPEPEPAPVDEPCLESDPALEGDDDPEPELV